MAHARRKFDETMKSLPKGKAESSSAYQRLGLCAYLTWLMKTAKDAIQILLPRNAPAGCKNRSKE